MRFFLSPLLLLQLVLVAVLTLPCSKAATILDPQVYLGIADGGLAATIPAADYQNYQPFSDWMGMSGGEMIVSVAPGQSVFSATMSAAWAYTPEALDSADYTKVWTFSFAGSFPSEGFDAGDQLWKETGFAGGDAWWRINQPSGGILYVKFKYEAITSEGIVVDDNGGAGYRGLIPEPQTVVLLGLCVPLVVGRRRKG